MAERAIGDRHRYHIAPRRTGRLLGRSETEGMTMHPVSYLPEDWRERLAARGERPFRAQQIFKWIHARGVLEPDKMTDLAEPLRNWLQEQGMSSVAQTTTVHRDRRSEEHTSELESRGHL